MFCVTFYSFKGGVGRTMALVNTALLLAQKGKRVLVVDFDLEAPGITSYESFRSVDDSIGLVDAVCRYSSTGISENIFEYIKKAETPAGDIWVLPAGNHRSSEYAQGFTQIDWNDLYRNKHGFLFFEDIKHQWSNFEGRGFDYVLIDSRTGHTDTAGICTRQLPDLVVDMFIPNEQNIRGLAPILHEVSASSLEVRSKIPHVLCASNIPDIDDEEGVIRKYLSLAQEIFPPEIVASSRGFERLNHYPSIDMLALQEFVITRPNSRLSQQYDKLYSKIISYNPHDRDGAIIRLREIIIALDQSFKRQEAIANNSDNDVSSALAEIRAYHRNDGEIEFLCALISRRMGDLETEIDALSEAIEQGYLVPQARINRAYANGLMGLKDKSADDLILAAFSPTCTRQQAQSAISKLRALAPSDWLSKIFHFSGELGGNYQLLDVVAWESLISRNSAEKFDNFIEASEISKIIDSKEFGVLFNNLVLLKVASLRPEGAISILNAMSGGVTSLPDMFNYAVARWMVDGEPDTGLFLKIDTASRNVPLKGPNLLQCLMLVSSITNPERKRIEELSEAARIVPVSGFYFNCDTFLLSDSRVMSSSLMDFRRKLTEGSKIVPKVVEVYRGALTDL